MKPAGQEKATVEEKAGRQQTGNGDLTEVGDEGHRQKLARKPTPINSHAKTRHVGKQGRAETPKAKAKKGESSGLKFTGGCPLFKNGND
jgi:hypothetical protein